MTKNLIKKDKKKPKKKAGRKKIVFKYNTLQNLLRIQCTKKECASVLECSEDTIEARVKEEYALTFSELKDIHSGVGKMNLRRLQWKHAESHYGMAIWLGKQYLNQTDKMDIDTEEIEKRFQFILQVIKMNIKDKDMLEKIASEIRQYKV